MMTHSDDMNEEKVRESVENKECVFIINTKDSSTIWNELRLIAHKSTPTT
jgi:hypothetical protein